MTLERQKYIDVDYPLAVVPAGFSPDFFQPKYDGIWADVAWDGVSSEATVTSRTGQLKATILVPNSVKRFGGFRIVAEYLVAQQRAVGSEDYGKLRCFDLVHTGENTIEQVPALNMTALPYKERYARLKLLLESQTDASTKWLLTPCYHMQHLANVWEFMVRTGKLEGVVYRRWDQPYAAPLYRAKLSRFDDLIIKGYKPGKEGKYVNTLGALILKWADDDDLEIDCSGMTDSQRYMFWHNQAKYLGTVVEVVSKGIFESGSLRHPQFSRLRDDKLPSECTKPKT